MKDQENQKINATVIFQVMGRPPEHLTKTLETLINKIDKESKIKVKKKDIKEPQKNEKETDTVNRKGKVEKKEFYSSFAEVELEFEEMIDFVVLLFKHMPAHVEINSPEYLALTSGGWSDMLNELIRRLHGYDELARVARIEKSILEKKLREILGSKNKGNKENNNEER